jgi:hypothetical protein
MDNRKTATVGIPAALSNSDRDFVLWCCADLAAAGYGFLHQISGSVRILYLVSGEIYRISESGLKRIR